MPSTTAAATLAAFFLVLACPSSAFLSTTPTLRANRQAPLSLTCKAASSPEAAVKTAISSLCVSLALLQGIPNMVEPAQASAPSSEIQGQFKVLQGAASTQDSGTRRTVTRGAVLDNSNFEGKKLTGISFQQSLCRDCNFKGANLKGASFFDGDLTQANFENADVSNVNFEMACLKDANLKNAVVNEAYILATTKLDGINIEGADFTDTFLRKDQQRYLCSRASGTNPKTGVDTKDSLQCSQVKDLK